MRQQHHHHQLDQKSVRGAPSLILAEKFDPSSDTMNKISTNVKERSCEPFFDNVKFYHFGTSTVIMEIEFSSQLLSFHF